MITGATKGESSSREDAQGAINVGKLAGELLFALKSLSVGYKPHPCGGFTTDDMEWRLGTAFTGEFALECLQRLQAAAAKEVAV